MEGLLVITNGILTLSELHVDSTQVDERVEVLRLLQQEVLECGFRELPLLELEVQVAEVLLIGEMPGGILERILRPGLRRGRPVWRRRC